MVHEGGLVFAFRLDGKGGGEPLHWEAVRSFDPAGGGILWAHIDYHGVEAKKWLFEESGLDEVVTEALTEKETRPRVHFHAAGISAILRGVNQNPNSDPEDMVSVRMWVEPGRIITMRHRRVMAIADLKKAVEAGRGPDSPGEFLDMVAERLLDRMAGVVSKLDDDVDDLEEQVLTAESYELRPRISDIRRQAISLRRYLAPQREALVRLTTEKTDVLDEVHRARIREAADRATRYVEDLDAARERASVTHEELDGRLSERMNSTMYVLSIVAAIFLPLGLITGLLGINVGGMPGADDPSAFWAVCLMLAVIVIAEIYLFKRKRWM
jgi:zinc transporter